MLRISPNTTNDFTINDLRIAILNYIIAKQKNEQLLVRFEDTDKENNIEGKEQEILELLQLFSIEHMPAVYQSENIKKYLQMAMQMLMAKKAFSCFCTEEKLAQMTNGYTGGCDLLEDHQVIDNEQPFTVRIKAPKEIDNFNILTKEKMPTYNFSCAIDDMLYDISTIIRTEEFLDDTPKQIHVRKVLEYNKPIEYIHIPKLQDNNTSVKSLVDEGYLPSAIANYLVVLGNNTPQEIFTLEEAIQWFDIQSISQEQITFDKNELNDINKSHMMNLDNMRFSKILGYADSDIGALAKIYIEHNNTIKQIKDKIDTILQSRIDPDKITEEYKLIKQTIQNAPFFHNFNDFKQYIEQETNLNEDKFLKPLQYIFTGNENGPDLNEIYPYIKNYLGEII